MAFGQAAASPRIHLETRNSAVVDQVGGGRLEFAGSQLRSTNFNPSVALDGRTMDFIYDSLRRDGTATVMTVYETDEEGAVGLWQMGSGSNRALWLNSQQVSYDNFAITYRKTTEQGVVIHTMLYQYPTVNGAYDGHDTLYVGREGGKEGEKNFCAMLYFPCKLDYRTQRQLESALAIRYGAQLHGPYVNSRSETLWNPVGEDSLYSFGVCGVGRDDRLALLQPKSKVRNGYLTIEMPGAVGDLTHVMMGHNGGAMDLGGELLTVDKVQYAVVGRQWKLRAHGDGESEQVRLGLDLKVPAAAVRLMLTRGDEVEIVAPKDADGLVFENIDIKNGEEYIVSILVNPAALQQGTADEGLTASASNADFRVMVHPNPTSGRYTAEVSQSQEDVVTLMVQDATGRVVEQETTDGKVSQYSHSGVLNNTGVYYVTVSSNGKQKTIKVIVVK